LRGAPELVAFGCEDDALARIRNADRELADVSRRDAAVAGFADAASVLVTGLTTIAVLAAAVAAHDSGVLDRVLLATLALLALSTFEAVQPLPAAARELAATLGAGRRVLELIDRQPRIRDPEHPAPAPSNQGVVVSLDGVTARYAPDQPTVLRDFDLRLEPGRHVALVGPSGSGKTTVTNLLL